MRTRLREWWEVLTDYARRRPLHERMRPSRIAYALGMLGFVSGCTMVAPTISDIVPRYVSGGLGAANGNGIRVNVKVRDLRSRQVFMRWYGRMLSDQGWQNGYHLGRPAPEVVKECFEQGLLTRGYMVSEAPTVVVEVGLREFFVELSAAQLFGVQQRVAASIIFEYNVRSGNGPLLVRSVEEVNSETATGDFNRRTRFESLLSDRLSRAVDKALDDPEFLAAMAKVRDSQATAVAKAKENVKVENLESPSPERPSSPVVWTPDSRHCLWVLAVGVGQYKDPQVPALPFARGDAERVRDWFMRLDVKGMTRDSIRVLSDEQATRENLLTQIDWLRKQALPEDAVFIYFAGHGAPELASDGTSVDAKYLVLYDTSPDTLFSTGFPLDDLMRRLDTVKAKTQVLILEACYAGPVGQEILKKTPTADLEIRPRSIQMLGEKGGRVILSASSGRQMAIASEEIKGGLFTHYLLSAWGDASQQLLSERFEEAKDQVRRASNRIGSYQEPAKFGDRNVDVILKLK